MVRELEIVGESRCIESDQLSSVLHLKNLRFEGYRRISSMRDEGLGDIPEKPGVYLVIRTRNSPPCFLNVGTAGRFKGKDPNVSLAKLDQEWVEGALILYVGQAGSKSEGTLRKRIGELIKFGSGKPVGHRGGRLLWQLSDADALMVCWKTVQNKDPRDVERELIQYFKAHYNGRRPFANLRD